MCLLTRAPALLVALAVPQLAATASSQCASAPAPMAAWLPLDADPADLLGRHPGTQSGSPRFVAGQVGGAIDFDSDDDLVVVADAPELNVNATGFTVEFWMRGVHDQPHGQYLVVDKSHGWVDSTGWLFQGWSGTGQLHFGMGAGGPSSSNFPVVGSNGDLLDGAYHHVAGTWNGSQLELFVDGVSQGTAGLSSPANNTRPVQLGASWGGGVPNRFFRGEVDELSIYPRALTAAEISAIANAGAAGKCRPAASCTVRNGRGVNLNGYACVTPPALGTNWVSSIVTEPHTVSTFMALGAAPAQLLLFGGEILFDPSAPVVFLGNGTGVYTVPLPGDVSLLGASLTAQGLRIDAPSGQPSMILLNALDLVLGF